MTRRAAWTVADIARLLKAARQSGERAVVEIKPDGTINLIVNDNEKPKVKEIHAL